MKYVMLFASLFLFNASINAREGNLSKAYQNGSLCERNEVSFFSCPTNNAKVISLCGRINSTPLEQLYYAGANLIKPDDDAWVQYRYGTARDVELSYPEVKTLEVFSVDSYKKPFMESYESVSFNTAVATYTIFNSHVNPKAEVHYALKKDSSGVMVELKSNNKVTTILCSSQPQTDSEDNFIGFSQLIEILQTGSVQLP